MSALELKITVILKLRKKLSVTCLLVHFMLKIIN